jgi:hypothetical protein
MSPLVPLGAQFVGRTQGYLHDDTVECISGMGMHKK